MLSTSSSEKDIDQSYKNFANGYITKPIEISDFLTALSKIEDPSFSVVKIYTGS